MWFVCFVFGVSVCFVLLFSVLDLGIAVSVLSAFSVGVCYFGLFVWFGV